MIKKIIINIYYTTLSYKQLVYINYVCCILYSGNVKPKKLVFGKDKVIFTIFITVFNIKKRY